MLVALAWGATGCSGSATPPSNGHVQSIPATSARTSSAKSRFYCDVPFPQSWQTALQTGVGAVQPGTRIGFAVAPNGSEYFASIHTASWSGVVAVDVSTGNQTEISQYPDPPNDQVAYGAFDGRWLVWAEGYSLSNMADWAMLAWDSRTGSVLTLYRSSDEGASPSDPIQTIPSVQNGLATWTEVSDRVSYVHLYNLRTQSDVVIYRGRAALGAFWGSDLLLTIEAPPRTDRFVAYSTRSHKQVALPTALAKVRGITYLAATRNQVVWAGSQSKGVWIWRSGYQRAKQIASATGYAEFFGEADSDFIWTLGGSNGSVVADPSTRSIAKFPFQYPEVAATGNAILVGYSLPGQGKTENPLVINSVLNVANLPRLPRCPG